MPVGIYCSCPLTKSHSNSVLSGLALPGVCGRDISASELGGHGIDKRDYNWALLDNEFSLVSAAGLDLSLAILTSWLFSPNEQRRGRALSSSLLDSCASVSFFFTWSLKLAARSFRTIWACKCFSVLSLSSFLLRSSFSRSSDSLASSIILSSLRSIIALAFTFSQVFSSVSSGDVLIA